MSEKYEHPTEQPHMSDARMLGNGSRRWTKFFHMESFPELRQLGYDNVRKAIPLNEHHHPDCFEFVFIEQGKAGWQTVADHYETRAGDVFHTRPNELHRGSYNIIEPCILWWLIVYVPTPEEQAADIGRNWLLLDRQEARSLIEGLWSLPRIVQVGPYAAAPLRKMKKALQKGDQFSQLEARIAFIDFLLQLLRPDHRLPVSRDLRDSIEAITSRIASYPAWNASLSELARQANVSPSHFHRVFQMVTGFTPKSYIERMKITEACRLLTQTGQSVTDISMSLGFATSQHFATVFRRHTGQTPTHWRNAGRDEIT